jgi:hypothetical protein
VTGGGLVVRGAGGFKGGLPAQLDALALIGAPSGKALLARLPPLAGAGLEQDGALHKLTLPLPVPYDVFGAVGDHAIVVATGEPSKALAAKVLAAGSGDAPLFTMSYDLGRFMALQAEMVAAFGEPAAKGPDFTKFGRGAVTLDVDPHGLAIWGTLELR